MTWSHANVLGVDVQRTGVVTCLREGRPPLWPPVAVAANRPDDRRLDWSALAARMDAFVGGDAAAQHGRHAVVARMGVDVGDGSLFGQVSTVSSGRAALLTALHDPRIARLAGRTAIVVVVGDVQVGVQGFRLERSSSGQTRVTAAAPAMLLPDTGAAHWVDEVIAAVRGRVPEREADAARPVEMWAPASEMGWRLSQAATDEEPVAWTGPLRERMVTPLDLSRRACLRWSSALLLAELLPGAMLKTARVLGQESDAMIIIGGHGAAWPFARRIAEDITHTLVIDEPHLALARGAAWWPEFGEVVFAACGSDDAQADASPSVQPTLALPGGDVRADLTVLGRHRLGDQLS